MWWDETAPDKLEPALEHGRFAMGPAVALDHETIVEDVWATGIEFDERPVEARFPSKPAIPHAGGVDPTHDWEGAASHVDAWKVKTS